MTNIVKSEILNTILSKMLDKSIIDASYQVKQLQGGTLGDVQLVTGLAEKIGRASCRERV